MTSTAAARYFCPFLDSEVVLTSERSRHITERHPEIVHGLGLKIAGTLADPDTIRRSAREPSALLFSRRYTEAGVGVHIVIVTLRDDGPPPRHWIVTAYSARRLPVGETVWTRS